MSKRYIDVAGVRIGGGAPVSIQSMTTADTADTQSVGTDTRAGGGGLRAGESRGV